MKQENGNKGPHVSYRKFTGVSQGSGENKPPVVPTRVAVMKADYKQAWLYFLFFVSLVIAWGIPARYFIARHFSFRAVDLGPRDATEFVALAYEGVSTNPREVSPERFREHFNALRDAGYKPITLEDIHNFYTEGTPLPRKAVLLTFDHARKSSYFDVRTILSRAGWPAVMFLWTLPIETEDPAGLRWPYVRAMLRGGAWEAGAQSHFGFQRIVADSEGTLRNYLTAPRWLSNEMRYETPDAFEERIRADHEYTRTLIKKETGHTPRAFAFPYGDFGQHDERAVLSRRLNMDVVSALYDMAFVHGSAALNTRYSDPRRLNRLLVQPEWTGEDLIAHLDSSWPRRQGAQSYETLHNPLVWLKDWGAVEIQDGSLRLAAMPTTTGAKAFMNGSDLFADFSARFRLRIDHGQLGLHFRATPDGERHVYLGLSHEGEVWLRQKHAGLPAFTLDTANFNPEESDAINLEVHIRGSQFAATVNGENLFSEITRLRGDPMPGMIGISVWEPIIHRAQSVFYTLDLAPFRQQILTWAPISSRDTALAYWLNQHAVRFTHIAPPWLRIASRAQAEQFGWDPDFFHYLAQTYSMTWTPEVVMDNIEMIDPTLPEHLAGLTVEYQMDGIYCNLSQLRGAAPLPRVTAWIQSLHQALEEQDKELLVRLPIAWERESTVAALLQSLPDLKIVFSDPAYEVLTQALPNQQEQLVYASMADFSTVNAPEVHELTGLDAVFEEWDSETRSKLLRQEGFDAFRAGRFDDALEIWTRWSEIEPQNEEPLRLMGDIHLQRNQHGLATEMYRQSLDRNPGQIALVTHTARVLDQRMQDPHGAVELLNLYARIFPGNPDIRLAQAEVLLRQNRRRDAGNIVRSVVEEYPDDLGARSMLHSLLGSPAERVSNLRAIIDIGTRPSMEPHFAHAIHQYDLLLWPETWLLMDPIARLADSENRQGIQGPYTRLMPRETIAQEAFNMRHMSDNWDAVSDAEEETGEPFLLAASPAAAEATLRLVNSDTMHSGFVEVLIGEARGDFWLYARRGEHNMIRFGFQHAGRMYMQIWHRGQLINNQSRIWTRTTQQTRLRLEIRGDAAFGMVDGEPAFGAPVAIPPEIGLGWWGISPWAPQFGVAQVSILEVSGGPTPVNIALFQPRLEEWTDNEVVEKLRDHAPHLQAMAPLWFSQELDGRVRKDTREDYTALRMMGRFHQIRLLPAIRSASPRVINIPDLIELAEEERLDGFTLLFARMPNEEWFKEVEEALIGSSLTLLAVQLGSQDTIDIREVSTRIGIFPGRRLTRTYPLIDMSDPEEAVIALERDPITDADHPNGEKKPAPDRVLYF